MTVGDSTPRDDRTTITVCRPTEVAAGLIGALESEGFEVVSFPLAQVVDAADDGAALKHGVDDLGRFSAVAFTSVNAVTAVRRALSGRSWPTETATYAVGRATSDAVTSAGFPSPFVPQTFTAAALGAEVPLEEGSGPIFAPFAELASNDFEIAVTARGGRVERVTAYRTIVPTHSTELIAEVHRSDLVLLTSPSIVERFAAILAGDVAGIGSPPVAVIGPRTADAAHALGLKVMGVASPHDDSGLVALATQLFSTGLLDTDR